MLRTAYELDENNALTKAVLANALVEEARTKVESDWREAEKLSREALDLNPGHPMAKTIRTLIHDQKRESFVEDCVANARKMQSSADLAGALSRIEEGLSVYPREPRLLQIQETVQRDHQTQLRQFRRRDVEELRKSESEVDAATDADAKQALGGRVRAIAEKYPSDGEVLTIANGILHRLGLLEVTRTISAGSHDGDSATVTYNTPPASLEATLAGPLPGSQSGVEIQRAASVAETTAVAPATSATASPAPPSKKTTAAKPPASTPAASTAKGAAASPSRKQPATSQRNSKLPMIVGAAAIALVVAIFFGVRRHNAPAPTQSTEVTPTASVPAATPAPPPAEPALPALKLTSDTGAGKVIFDDQPPAEFQDGQWILEKIAAGDHKLKFEGAQGEASFAFSSTAGSAPAISGPIVSKNVTAIVVISAEGHVHVYASEGAAKVSLDGQPPVELPQDGLDLPSVSPGAHELAVIRGSDDYKLSIEAASTPTLSAFLESSQNLGALVVNAGQDGAKVFLNGKAQPQLTQGGKLRIPNLEPKEYVVRVAKNGFQELPEQKVRLRKGEATVTFNLQPTPHLASLTIQGAAPGVTVLIDQAAVGTIRSDGTLTVSTVTPGDHVVGLRKDGFKLKQIKKHFVVGTAVSLASADVIYGSGAGRAENYLYPRRCAGNSQQGGRDPYEGN